MRILTFALFLFTVIISSARRLSHFELEQTLNHYFDFSMVPKGLIAEVMRDGQVLRGLLMGRMNTPEFKRTVIEKGLEKVSKNQGYQRTLAQNFLKDVHFFNDQDKLKALKLALNDSQLRELVLNQSSKDVLFQRGIAVLKQDPDLRQKLERNGKHYHGRASHWEEI